MKTIFKKGTLAVLTALAIGSFVSAAHAHFQLVYTPEINIKKPATLPFRLIFWHPMENGHVMDMDKPQKFFYTMKGEETDLISSLQEITFRGEENEGKAYAADVEVKRNGDYIFVLIPAPYLEPSEDIYIQQIAKSFVNKGGIPTGWHEPVGLPTEIVPLNKPTNILTGSTFSGIVLSEGKPVPGLEVEIEYMSARPDLATNAAFKPSVEPALGGTLVAVTDANGMFTFGIPKAGFWGFAALGSGPNKEHKGKELSQDAVIWVEAYDLPVAK